MKTILLVATLCGLLCARVGAGVVEPSQYVNVFLGTSITNNGHTTPAAAWPFGMVQAAPIGGGRHWSFCSGYNYEAKELKGFAQTAISGTGVPELGDVLILPVRDAASTAHRLDKGSERGEPGYYAVRFPEVGIGVEATASERTTLYRFDFGATGSAGLRVDLQWGNGGDGVTRVRLCETGVASDRVFTGHLKTTGWTEREFFFALETSQSFTATRMAQPDARMKGELWHLAFGEGKGIVGVKVALSTVSTEAARRNLATEIPDWDFAKVRNDCRAQWNRILSCATIEGTVDEKAKFYTALYRTCVQPNNLADVDGLYRAADGKVRKATGGRFFSTFSLWDTYRAAHPLYTLTAPEKVPEIVNSMLDQYDVLGHLPMWGLWGNDTECMLGLHSVSVIVDAWAKGFKGFDVERAYEAIRTTQRVSHIQPPETRRKFFHLRDEWEILDRYGYYPIDLVKGESVSRVLENSYDDWCAARLARALGKTEDAQFFARRAQCYRNVFDLSTGLMRGRDSAGRWREPFDPFEIGHSSETANDFTEGNAYQWVWHVLHEPEELVELMGGRSKFTAQLNSLFELPETVRGQAFTGDVTGLIGQYAQGNEPNHHVLYFFNLTDRPERGRELITRVCRTMFRNTVDGLPGNEDCGQMSAWYVFSSLGFYPVSPASGEYWIGAPQHRYAALNFADERRFEVIARGQSPKVVSVMLNGRKLEGFKLKHADIIRGGRLEIVREDAQ